MKWLNLLDMADRCIRVAVVDDDVSVSRALVRILRLAAFEVSSYSSGAEFLAGIESADYDCIILDLHMPNVNGFDVLRHFAQTEYLCPVIAVTGHDNPRTRVECLALGAARYLPKPLDDEVLVAEISQVAGCGNPRRQSR